jgi:hypothetical protein
MTDEDITVQDVYDGFTPTEKTLLHTMVGDAVRHKTYWRLVASFGYTSTDTYLHLSEIQKRVLWYIVEEAVKLKKENSRAV